MIDEQKQMYDCAERREISLILVAWNKKRYFKTRLWALIWFFGFEKNLYRMFCFLLFGRYLADTLIEIAIGELSLADNLVNIAIGSPWTRFLWVTFQSWIPDPWSKIVKHLVHTKSSQIPHEFSTKSVQKSLFALKRLKNPSYVRVPG